jgi:hypothetical protein
MLVPFSVCLKAYPDTNPDTYLTYDPVTPSTTSFSIALDPGQNFCVLVAQFYTFQQIRAVA